MKKLFLPLLLVVVLVMPFVHASPAQATGAVCPPGNVKWETDGGYEYTDGSATVSGNADQVTVTATEGYEVVGVCIKIGGPGGGETISFTSAGTFGPFAYGISHVVVTTRPATPPPPP